MPFIPVFGTKGIPSAVPPAIRQKAHFSGADTPKTCNESHTAVPTAISDGSSRGKAQIPHPCGSHHSAFAEEMFSVRGDPIIAFAYRENSNTHRGKMQVCFRIFGGKTVDLSAGNGRFGAGCRRGAHIAQVHKKRGAFLWNITGLQFLCQSARLKQTG